MIESQEQLGITTVRIVEPAYVLTSVYSVPREKVVDALVALIRRHNITTVGAEKSTW
ncbi:MAG: hypothetical protein QN121_06030 [Armatimonadota bacterium]|nr:hypothetical protein [Armatimonadota bacterium]